MRTSAKAINDEEVIDITTLATGKALQASGLLDDAFLEGWTIEKVLTYPKGQRPPIETYMKPLHKNNQLNKFRSEGGAFIIRKRDIEEGNFITLAPRKFVGLESEMKVVMDKYYQAGAETKILIEELDLGDGYFKITDEVFLVNVEPNGKFEFDLPNGNEGGAYEGFWVPGGFTAHGISEAVLSNSGNFTHNQNWQTFVDLFGKQNVKKIK